jgi:alpha-N-arabinofuranosidase
MRPATSSNGARPVRKRILPNLENSLVTGLYLNAFIRHAQSVRLASFSSMPHSIGMNLKNSDGRVLLETIFYPFALYSSTCGQLALDVFWTGDTFSGTYKDRTFTGIRTLDVAATLNKARKQLVVYVVNQSKDETMEVTITLTSGHFTGNIKVSVVNGPDIKAENTEDNPNLVGIHDTSIIASGNSFTLAFEPHSVTALICDVG